MSELWMCKAQDIHICLRQQRQVCTGEWVCKAFFQRKTAKMCVTIPICVFNLITIHRNHWGFLFSICILKAYMRRRVETTALKLWVREGAKGGGSDLQAWPSGLPLSSLFHPSFSILGNSALQASLIVTKKAFWILICLLISQKNLTLNRHA